jgi:hypothetical protein
MTEPGAWSWTTKPRSGLSDDKGATSELNGSILGYPSRQDSWESANAGASKIGYRNSRERSKSKPSKRRSASWRVSGMRPNVGAYGKPRLNEPSVVSSARGEVLPERVRAWQEAGRSATTATRLEPGTARPPQTLMRLRAHGWPSRASTPTASSRACRQSEITPALKPYLGGLSPCGSSRMVTGRDSQRRSWPSER